MLFINLDIGLILLSILNKIILINIIRILMLSIFFSEIFLLAAFLFTFFLAQIEIISINNATDKKKFYGLLIFFSIISFILIFIIFILGSMII